MEFTKIKETCLYISDLAQTKAFYHDKLNFPVIGEVTDRHVFFRVGGSVLLCFLPEVSKIAHTLPPHFGSGNLHLAFETTKEEYENWKAKIRQQQIPIEYEHDWGKGFHSFYFRDPDDHLLEVVMEGMWEK